MRAGSLRTRATLEDRVEAKDAKGGLTLIWAGIGRAWVSVEALSGDEAVVSGRPEAVVTHRVRMRYRSGVKAQQRLFVPGRDGDRFFEIESVVNLDERNRELELLCRETTE